MASYTLKIYDVPQENKNIELSYNSNDGHSTGSTTIENTTWTFTLQNLSYSKAIYKPGELIFKLQISGCSGVNAIYSTFKGKKVELAAKADNQDNSIAKGYYIFGIQIEKKGNVYYATFQAYDPFKFLTLDKYCKAYTGKKFILDIFWNTDLWPNNLPTAIKDTQFPHEESIRQKAILKQDKLRLEGIKQALTEQKTEKENSRATKESDKTEEEGKTNKNEDKIKTLDEEIKHLDEEIEHLEEEIKHLDEEIEKLDKEINAITTTGDSVFNRTPQFLYYYNGVEFIQPYLVQYNESFFDFLVRVSNRCGEFLYYEDGYFNIGWGKKTKKDKDGKEQDDITPITEYVSVNFSDETATAWKEDYIVSSHHNYPLTDKNNRIKRYPMLLPLDEKKLQKEYGNEYSIEDKGEEITITYKKSDKDSQKTTDETVTVKRSEYEISKDGLQLQDSHLASDENLVSLPPKDKYTKWTDFALWPGYFLINVFTDIVNSANIAEAVGNLISDTGITILNCSLSAKASNDDYEDKNFKKGTYTNDRKNNDRIYPFSTSESVKNALDSYVTFSLEFYEAIRKGIEANERARIQIALGTHFYPLALGSLIELDGEKYIVVQMNGCANSGAEALDIEAIPYDQLVFPPAAPVGPIREAKAQRAFITHNADPLKMNRVRVRYPWQSQTEDPTPWIRIALPMASDGSGFNFLPQIDDEAIINYENGNIEKPYVEGMLYTRAEKENESPVPYAHKKDKARVISSVNGHSIIFSDPSASSDAFNSLSPLMSTIKSFCPTGFIKTELSLRDHKVDIFPDSFKKAMGGIEFTDEHGLYSISMSSDKRAISIDSPLGKVNISAFTGITISAPNGNVRIEGKNIDIVAGNNLSISSGNNIASHFWPVYRDKSLGESIFDSLKDAGKTIISKLEIIDMNLIRTAFETFVRPCGGTMLIKSNRYLCFEAGKGEAQIAGRQTVKQLGMRATMDLTFRPDQIVDVTIPYRNNVVATNRIPIHINNAIQAIQAAKKAFDAINANMSRARNEYRNAYQDYIRTRAVGDNFVNNNPQDFGDLYPNNIDGFSALQMQNKPGDDNPVALERYNNIETDVNVLNRNALYIKDKQLTSDKIWADFKDVYLQDTVVRQLINIPAIENPLKNLFVNSTTQNYWHNLGPRNLAIDQTRELVYLILNLLINNQTTTKTKDSTHCSVNRISLGQPITSYDNTQWGTLINNNLTYVNGDPVQLRKRDKVRLGLIKWNLLGAHKLDGILDQYIWDTNEDAGKILFSDQEGETLNFQNKEIHYYKKSETDPLTKLKQILGGI